MSPRKLNEYHPISLCNVIYKFITKTLANRLKKWLGEAVSEFQSMRLISNNVVVASKLMHSMGKKNNGNK